MKKSNSYGNVYLYKQTDDKYDKMYADWGEGPLDENSAHVKVSDQSILKSMAQGNNPSGSSSRQDMKNIFKFAADTFNNREWGLYYNGASYELTTKGAGSEVGSSLEDVTWKVHSHPNVKANTRDEYNSIGFWAPSSAYNENGDYVGCDWNQVQYGISTNGKPCDWRAYVIEYERTNGKPAKSHVYFPVSGRYYKINYNAKPNPVKL